MLPEIEPGKPGMRAFTDNARGAILMTAGMAAFTINDACMKALSDQLPLFQAIFLRGLATSLILLAAGLLLGGLEFRLGARDRLLLGFRTLGEIGAAYFFITALFNAPLANVTAILQALPLAITLAAALFLGEAVGARRWTAILVGFVGVLLIVRPGSAGFNSASVYAVIAVACVTLRDLTTRQMSREVPSLTVSLAAALGVATFGGLGATGVDWQPVGTREALQLAGATIFLIVGYVTIVLAVRLGDTSAVAPFRYTGLIWALILGVAIFGEWPSALTLLGGAVVVATGIFTLYRERRAQTREPMPLRIR